MGSLLLEREAELAALADGVREAATGRGSVVLVCGEAGIGKSSLVARLPELVEADRAGADRLVRRPGDPAGVGSAARP
ncbi:MAG: AAA family ATPase [Nocardioides sp.]